MIYLNKKNRKNTIQKHLEISENTNKILKDLTKDINEELDGKYYEWQIFEVAILSCQLKFKNMNIDQKYELFKPYNKVIMNDN